MPNAKKLAPKTMTDKKFFHRNRKNLLIAGAAVVVIALSGYIFMYIKASGFFASTEPESASLTGNVSIVNDAAASNGKAISFNAPVVVTPPPTPPPTGGGGTSVDCPAYPSFPTTDCTGYKHTGVVLTVVNGIYHARTPGEVIDSKDFRDGIEVQANNVTIKRSKVGGRGDQGPTSNYVSGIWVDQGISGTLIEDVEITSLLGITKDSPVDDMLDRAITGFKTNGLTIRRVYAHNIVRGFQYGCNTTIEDSYIDEEINESQPGNHMSAIGGETCDNITLNVRHNHISLGPPNINNSHALLYYAPDSTGGNYGPQHLNMTFQNNLINGGSFCMWLTSDPKFSGTLNITGNRFGTEYYDSCGKYGALFKDNLGSEGSVGVTWSDNRFQSGEVVSFQ